MYVKPVKNYGILLKRKENKMKHLKIKVKKFSDDWYVGIIIEQTHRCEEFGENGSMFKASVSEIHSVSYPYLSFNLSDILYVRGNEIKFDATPILIPADKIDYVRIMVREYNEYFKDKSELELEKLENPDEFIIE